MPKSPTARTLFIERMKREGKYEEWRRRYKEAKKDVAPENWKAASDKVMEEMGFLGKLVEREIHERFLKFGMAGIPEQIEAAQAQLDQNDLIKVRGDYDITDSELPPDISFVFHSLHKAVGDMTSWKVAPEDAPTPGAWNMLIRSFMWIGLLVTKRNTSPTRICLLCAAPVGWIRPICRGLVQGLLITGGLEKTSHPADLITMVIAPKTTKNSTETSNGIIITTI